jgi:hypothetical protein
MPDFDTPFQQKLAPLLAQHQLHDPHPCTRPPCAGVFSRLFAVESAAAVLDTVRALDADPTWHKALARLGARFGVSAQAPLPYAFGLYSAPAQGRPVKAGPGTHQGLWHSWSVQDGLPSAVACRFEQDDSGRLWITTTDGLACFDGTRFHSFTEQDGVPRVGVSAVYVDQADQVWLNTRDGVCRFDGQRGTLFSKETVGLQTPVWCFCEDDQGRLWLGGHDGVRLFDDPHFIPFSMG